MFRELDVGQSALLTDIAMCINYYRLFSPGLYCCIHASVQLDDGTRFCPGVVVQVNHGRLKQCEPDDCFNGPPNFVLDVFGDDMLDYEHRRGCYERHGVIEYVALRLTEPVEWVWNRLIATSRSGLSGRMVRDQRTARGASSVRLTSSQSTTAL